MIEISRRRSERLLITFPIRVEGSDAKGVSFCEDTRTLVVNRHGARIQLRRSLAPGQTLRIVNLVGKCQADFRVVGPTQPMSDRGGEWGVELRDEQRNMWGIEFPPVRHDDAPCSALLECRRCHTVGLTHISLVELDVLHTAGLLTRDCQGCGQPTPWGHAQKQVGMPVPGTESDSSIKEVVEAPHPAKDRRGSPRVSLRLPIRVRNWYGTEEISKSENVSKGGLAFFSEKRYEIGEALQITCPYDPGADNIESRARVVRRIETKGSGAALYGIRYETGG